MRATKTHVSLLGLLEGILLGAVLAFASYQWVEMDRMKTTMRHVDTVKTQLKALQADGSITRQERHDIEENLSLITFPRFDGSGPSKYLGFLPAGLIFLQIGTGIWKRRLEKGMETASDGSDIPPAPPAASSGAASC